MRKTEKEREEKEKTGERKEESVAHVTVFHGRGNEMVEKSH